MLLGSWIRYLGGTDENGKDIEIVDAFKDQLVPLGQQVASDDNNDTTAILVQILGFEGDIPPEFTPFRDQLAQVLASLKTVKAKQTLQDFHDGKLLA